jgi:hypothetical protein
MMEAVRTSETSVDNFLHGGTSQKTNLNSVYLCYLSMVVIYAECNVQIVLMVLSAM